MYHYPSTNTYGIHNTTNYGLYHPNLDEPSQQPLKKPKIHSPDPPGPMVALTNATGSVHVELSQSAHPSQQPPSLLNISSLSTLGAQGTYVSAFTVAALIDRVKSVLVRDNLKQKDLAQFVGISGSTLSPLLKHKYMHTKPSHLQTLIDWVLTRDRQFVSMVNSRIRLLGLDVNTILLEVGITLEEWTAWLTLTPGCNRTQIDRTIQFLILERSQTRMTGGPTASHSYEDDEHYALGPTTDTHTVPHQLTFTDPTQPPTTPNYVDPNSALEDQQSKTRSIIALAFPSLPKLLVGSVTRVVGNLPIEQPPSPEELAAQKKKKPSEDQQQRMPTRSSSRPSRTGSRSSRDGRYKSNRNKAKSQPNPLDLELEYFSPPSYLAHSTSGASHIPSDLAGSSRSSRTSRNAAANAPPPIE